MSQHKAETVWIRGADDFLDNRYSRRHLLKFDGGLEIPGSSSPANVPLPYSDPAALDPEEALVSAVSSCHMLWFLSIAANQKFRVDRYRDEASGVMEKDAAGRLYMSMITLRPDIDFSGQRRPTPHDIEKIHHEAHERCYIANSIKARVAIQPPNTKR